MEQKSDRYYIDLILQGDVNAYTYLINRYKNMAFTIAGKIVKNREDAEEVIQDSFLKVYQKLDTFKGESKFSTWLYSIVYRTAITKIRKKQITVTAIDDFVLKNHHTEDDFPQLEEMKKEEQKIYVKRIIDRLPPVEATLITLYYLNDNNVEEIEKITGLTQSNIKVKLFRSRKKLYSELLFLLKKEVNSIL